MVAGNAANKCSLFICLFRLCSILRKCIFTVSQTKVAHQSNILYRKFRSSFPLYSKLQFWIAVFSQKRANPLAILWKCWRVAPQIDAFLWYLGFLIPCTPHVFILGLSQSIGFWEGLCSKCPQRGWSEWACKSGVKVQLQDVLWHTKLAFLFAADVLFIPHQLC